VDLPEPARFQHSSAKSGYQPFSLDGGTARSAVVITENDRGFFKTEANNDPINCINFHQNLFELNLAFK